MTKKMDKQNLKTKLKTQTKNLAWRAITTVILTLTAVITVWCYAAFIEPSIGPNNSDQDFLQNILGANNADNDFTSSLVASNADGSIIEREEYQQTQIGTYVDATTTPSAAASVFAALKYIQSQSSTRDCTDSDSVGALCGGGMKFAAGLVVTPSNCTDSATPACNGATDALKKTWSGVSGSDEPADSTTDGWSNTIRLVAYDSQQANAAAQYCYDMAYEGYNDWYLPAKDELNTLYGQKVTVGGFIANYYWSSTGGSTCFGWGQDFNNGDQYVTNKTTASYIRCIRRY
jgi:hypothetical protein